MSVWNLPERGEQERVGGDHASYGSSILRAACPRDRLVKGRQRHPPPPRWRANSAFIVCRPRTHKDRRGSACS